MMTFYVAIQLLTEPIIITQPLNI